MQITHRISNNKFIEGFCCGSVIMLLTCVIVLIICHSCQKMPETGFASWYKPEGSATASGVVCSNGDFVAAHKTLPFGSRLRVTAIKTGLSVDIVIVDRGPYISGRIIDLSPAAFKKIGKLSDGILKIKIEKIKEEK